MKKFLFLFLSLAVSSLAVAQTKPGKTTLNLTVLKTDGQPMALTEVKLTEMETEDFYLLKTDAEGKLTQLLDKGRFWQIDIGEIVDWGVWQIENKPAMVMTLNRTITYAVEEYHHYTDDRPDRASLTFTQVQQNVGGLLAPTATHSVFKLTVLKADKSPLSQFPVRLTCLALQTQYLSMTGGSGTAQFLLPVGQEFDIDIDGNDNFNYIKTGANPNSISKRITYQPCTFNQYVKNDTLIQNLSTGDNSCSGATEVTITVKHEGGGIWANEPVFVMDVEDTTKVIRAMTDANGQARFLLPKGHAFRVDFQKQKFATRVELSGNKGIGHAHKSITYRPPNPQVFAEHRPVDLPPPTWLKMKSVTLPEELKRILAGEGMEILDLQLRVPHLNSIAIAEFDDSLKTTGFDVGLLITSGSWQNAIGPNWTESASTGWSGQPLADSLLTQLNKGEDFLFDGCIIDMTVRPQGSHLSLEYLLGSEEYPEYLDFHDLAGIFFWGGEYGNKPKNIALLPDHQSRISVVTVNHLHNKQWYKPSNPGSELWKTWQYDGFTIPLKVERKVTPGQTYHLRLVIADHRDAIYDSGFFIRAKSLKGK